MLIRGKFANDGWSSRIIRSVSGSSRTDEEVIAHYGEFKCRHFTYSNGPGKRSVQRRPGDEQLCGLSILQDQDHGAVPCALDEYLQSRRALAAGKLDERLREQIALTVAQVSDCEYSLAGHSFAAERLRLTEDEILASLGGYTADRKAGAALQSARQLCRTGEARATGLSQAGHGEGEIVEIVPAVVLKVFESRFNNITNMEIDVSLTSAA